MHYCLLVGIGDGLLAYLVFSLRSVWIIIIITHLPAQKVQVLVYRRTSTIALTWFYTLTTLGIIIMVTKTIATYLYSLVNGGLMLVILTSHSPGIAVCSM